MKRGCLILAFVIGSCLVLLQIGCQEQAKAPEAPETGLTEPQPPIDSVPQPAAVSEPKTAGKQPRITFEKAVYDLGEVGPMTTHTCEFKFRNTGDATLKIQKVQTCCGFKGELKGRKTNYAPGEGGVAKITYYAGNMPAKILKHQYVLSNDPETPKVRLTVRGELVLKVKYQPDKLKFTLAGDDANVAQLTLTSVDNRPFAVRSFKAVADCISADFDKSEEATKIVLTARLDTEKLKNRTTGYIRIGLTHPKCRTINVPFEVLPKFTTDPLAIVVRNAARDTSLKRDIWVLNNYGDDFEIESASSDKGIIKLVGQEKVDNRYRLAVEITPPASGSRFFTDIFRVKIKTGETLIIRCRGYYAQGG